MKKDILKDLLAKPGKKHLVSDFDSSFTGDLSKQDAKEQLAKDIEKLSELQSMLYAQDRYSILIIFQAMDAAGKDGTIKHVMSGINPQGCQVYSFKQPSAEELDHDYLWRIIRTVPPRGKIGVMNRSHYEDVLVTRVHHMEKGYAMPSRVTDDSNFYPKRYQQIRNWEQYLYENGYRVVKVYLNVSRDEQKRRFLDRLEREDKHWKLSVDDMRERRLWKQYDEAFEDAINATATKESPWYVLPADDKWFTRYLMSEILLDVLMDVNPDYPPLDPAEAAKVPTILAELENGE